MRLKLVVLSGCILQLASCADFSAASSANQGVKIEYASGGSPRILYANAALEQGHTVIRGELGFPERARYRFFTGRLQAAARTTDGALVELPDATIAPRIKPRVAGRRADFILDTGRVLAKDTTVTLRYSNPS